jgi:hypothetical protein
MAPLPPPLKKSFLFVPRVRLAGRCRGVGLLAPAQPSPGHCGGGDGGGQWPWVTGSGCWLAAGWLSRGPRACKLQGTKTAVRRLVGLPRGKVR